MANHSSGKAKLPLTTVVLVAGIVVIILMGLFPPWNYVHTWFNRDPMTGGRTSSKTDPAGYKFVFSPPTDTGNYVSTRTIYDKVVKINWRKLMIQWSVVGVVTLLLYFLVRAKIARMQPAQEPSSSIEKRPFSFKPKLTPAIMVLAAGIIVIIMMGLFPPWNRISTTHDRETTALQGTPWVGPIEYRYLFNAPPTTQMYTDWQVLITVHKVNTKQLLIQWLIVGVISILLAYLVRAKKPKVL